LCARGESLSARLVDTIRRHLSTSRRYGKRADTKKDSIIDAVEQLRRRIAKPAYDLFLGRDGWGDAIGDWLSARAESSI